MNLQLQFTQIFRYALQFTKYTCIIFEQGLVSHKMNMSKMKKQKKSRAKLKKIEFKPHEIFLFRAFFSLSIKSLCFSFIFIFETIIIVCSRTFLMDRGQTLLFYYSLFLEINQASYNICVYHKFVQCQINIDQSFNGLLSALAHI